MDRRDTMLIQTLLVIGCMVTFTNCSNNSCRMELYGTTQGTYYKVVYYDENRRNLKEEVDSLLNAFDMSLSVYNPHSLVSRINNGDTSVVVDDFLMENLLIAGNMYSLSDGAFDVTAMPLFDYWGFGSLKRDSLMSSDMMLHKENVSALLDDVGFDKVVIDTVNRKVRFNGDNMKLCFNAVAQGYSVGVVARLLDSCGIENYLVEIGGEIYAKGSKPNGDLWKVGIEKPAENQNDAQVYSEIVEVSDKSIVTSGNYRKYYEIDGERYSHTIDPRSGFPVKNEILSATVIHDDPAYADAWATTFMVVGLEKTKSFLNKHPEMQVFIINSDGSEYKSWTNMK